MPILCRTTVIILERSHSGLVRTRGKRVDLKGSRGFESLPLRHSNRSSLRENLAHGKPPLPWFLLCHSERSRTAQLSYAKKSALSSAFNFLSYFCPLTSHFFAGNAHSQGQHDAIFFTRKRLSVSAIKANDALGVPNVRPVERKCAI